MEFVRDDTQRMIADTVRRILNDANEFTARRARLSAEPPQRMALWPLLADTGVIGSGFLEDVGGFGGAPRDIAAVQYLFGRSLVVEPFLGVAMAGRILARAPEEGRSAIERIIAGKDVIVLAHVEGFDPFAAPSLAATKTPDAYWLNGQKAVVRHADVADGFVVTAVDAAGATSCFLVDRNSEGVGVESYRLMDGAAAGTLTLRETPARLLLGGEASRTAIVDALEYGIVGIAAEAVGIMDGLNEATREYMRTRVQFGVPIGSFQALQHRSADMFIAGEEARVATDAVIDSLTAPAGAPQRSARVSALKAVIDQAGTLIAHEAVQLHGGMGVSNELIVSHYMRRLATIRSELGSAGVHRSRYMELAK